MTYKQIATMIAGIGLPNAYYVFPKDTEQAPPFICFYFPGSDDLYADDTNYSKIRPLIVELYTANKDFATEATVEAALNANGLVFSRTEIYLSDEQMYLITYNTEVCING